MSSRRKVFGAILAAFSLGLGGQVAAQPSFENNTPVGFSASDSTTTSNFVTDSDVSILVDLSEAANATHPVIANFHKLERSVTPGCTSASTAGYMHQAIEVDDSGIIHRAWVQGNTRSQCSDQHPALWRGLFEELGWRRILLGYSFRLRDAAFRYAHTESCDDRCFFYG